MASFIAAGTAYATHGVNMIPFFIYYSMFGFQRDRRSDLGRRRHALPRLPARRHRRPHDARRRRPAAPGRPQPAAVAAGAELRARTTRRSPTRSPSSSRTASRGCISDGETDLLLPDGDERAVRAARHAGGRPRGHPARNVQAAIDRQAGSAALRAQLFGQRRHPHRGGPGPDAARRQVRRARRRLERDQLQRALSRRQRVRALEPAASGRSPPRPVRDPQPRRGAGCVRRRVRLREGAAARHRPLGAEAA